MFEVFADMQRGHYVRNTLQTGVKARAAKHAISHLDPNLLSRGETHILQIHSVTYHTICQCVDDEN